MKKVLLILFIIIIFSCSNKNIKINKNLKKAKYLYDGIWLDIDEKGKFDNSHFIIIEILEKSVLIIDLQIFENEVVKNSFNAFYEDNIII